MNSLKAFFLAAMLGLSVSVASAQSMDDAFVEKPSAGAIAFDLLFVRPLSLVGTVAGVGLFAIVLPISIIQGEPPKDAAERLIVEPARYTFMRELGKIE